MNVQVVERSLWLLVVMTLLAGAGTAVHRGRAHRAVSAPLPALPSGAAAVPSTDELLDAVADIRDGDLFRADRTPLDPAATPVPMSTAPPPAPHPQLVLRGLIGGPPWSAIVDGIPGSDGATVLRVGQSSGGVTLQSVRRDTIILKARDTTWKLTVSRAW